MLQEKSTVKENLTLPHSIKSFLLFAGAFTFSFLLDELVHDSGHYLCHRAYGNSSVRVHFDPFGGTRIFGASGLPDRVLAIISAAGPFANLFLGLICFFPLWRKRSPQMLPLLLWGPIALIQEGATFSLGLLTPGGDARWIATLGIPLPIIWINGITFLVTGLCSVVLLLDLVGIIPDDPIGRKMNILFWGMCGLMLIRCMHSFLSEPATILENLIPLTFSLILVICTVAMHGPISKMMDTINFPESTSNSRFAVSLSLILGTSIFAIQLLILN